MFEDKAGAELLHLRAQRNMTMLVNNDQMSTIGNNHSTAVQKNDHVAIVTDIDGDMITTVSGDWNGHGDSQDAFAQSARVIENQPYSDELNVPVPQMPGEGGPMQISGFMSPIPLLSPDNGVYAGLSQLPVAVAGASFHTIAGQVTTGNDSMLWLVTLDATGCPTFMAERDEENTEAFIAD